MQKISSCRWLSVLVAVALVSGCAGGGASSAESSLQTTSFVVLALSRGKGVPTAARALLSKAQILLVEAKNRGADIAISQQRIGLEGEAKLCAEFSDPQLGGRWFKKLQDLARGIDLINVAIEPCSGPH